MLYRVWSDDKLSQSVIEVPTGMAHLRAKWTRSSAVAVGTMKAVKSLGKPWMMLFPGIDPATNKQTIVGVLADDKAVEFFDAVEEVPPDSSIVIPE